MNIDEQLPTLRDAFIRHGVVLAYLFRFQEYALGGWGSNWPDLFRVDILNCIGFSMIVVPWLAAPLRQVPRSWDHRFARPSRRFQRRRRARTFKFRLQYWMPPGRAAKKYSRRCERLRAA